MGMPPSAWPASASAMAAVMNSSISPPRSSRQRVPERLHQYDVAAKRQTEADEPRVMVDVNPDGRDLNRGHRRQETGHTGRDPRRQGDQGKGVEAGAVPVGAFLDIQAGQVE